MTLGEEKAEMRGVLTHMRAFHSLLTTTDRIPTATLNMDGSVDPEFIIALDLSFFHFLDAFHITTLNKFLLLEQIAIEGG